MRSPLAKSVRLSAFVIGLAFVWTGLALGRLKPKDLSPRYKQWLVEEVVYIITPKEKEVFLQLQSNSERDLFIQAFWKQRDPTIGTEKNEFQDEHYRRFNYVNRRYRYSGKPGWKTDRGKVYILLGEPNNIQPFAAGAHYPAELWAYQGLNLHSLPSAFSILFFQKGRIGDYILYVPGMMGPQDLLQKLSFRSSNLLREFPLSIFPLNPRTYPWEAIRTTSTQPWNSTGF